MTTTRVCDTNVSRPQTSASGPECLTAVLDRGRDDADDGVVRDADAIEPCTLSPVVRPSAGEEGLLQASEERSHEHSSEKCKDGSGALYDVKRGVKCK